MMATVKKLKKLKFDRSAVRCAFCLTETTKLKLLKCYHSCCAKCVQTKRKGPLITCPKCHLETNIGLARRNSHHQRDDNNGEKLLDNFLQKSLDIMESFNKPKLCRACNVLGKQSVSTFICFECQREPLCDDCINMHHIMKTTESHTPVKISDIFDSDQTMSSELRNLCARQYCAQHGRPGGALKTYCATCDCLVCKECMLGSHTGHICSKTSDVAARMREDVNKKLEECLPLVKNATTNPLSDKLKARTRTVMDVITRQADAHINWIRSKYFKEEGARQVKLQNLKQILENMRSFVDLLNAVSSDTDIIQNYTGLYSHLKAVRDDLRQVTAPHKCSEELAFDCPSLDQTRRKLHSAFGTLHAKPVYYNDATQDWLSEQKYAADIWGLLQVAHALGEDALGPDAMRVLTLLTFVSMLMLSSIGLTWVTMTLTSYYPFLGSAVIVGLLGFLMVLIMWLAQIIRHPRTVSLSIKN